MPNVISTFAADEDGAVTIDWVVLTAAVVGLAIAILAIVTVSVVPIPGTIAGELANISAADDEVTNTN